MWLSEVRRSGRFNVPRFLLRRFLRIWPALAASLGVMMFFQAMTSVKDSSARADLQHCKEEWWKVLLAINNWLPTFCMVRVWQCHKSRMLSLA